MDMNPSTITPTRVFGRLTVISEPFRRDSDNRVSVLCRCVCGAEKAVRLSHLEVGRIISCGCALRDSARTRGKAFATHNMSYTPEYSIWHGIMQRCYSENKKCYPRYGGRGIRVCDSWHEFVNFYRDMGTRPSPAHSIDRFPNNDGNYEPGNCRWATPIQQSNNRRSSRFLTLSGETHTLAEWSRIYGVNDETLRARLQRGMDLDAALGRRARL